MISVKIIAYSATSYEADLQISDGTHKFICFAHPWKYDSVFKIQPFIILGCEDMSHSTDNEKIIPLGGYRHKIFGSAHHIVRREIKVGSFIFINDIPFPKDTFLNNFLEFTCDRISI